MKKTQEEIQALKDNWLKDPCCDIEETEGFDDYVEELLNFRRQTEAEWNAKNIQRENTRVTLVREQTGVIDADIVSALSTWNEIEITVSGQDRYIREMGQVEDQVKVELMQAQIRATLLQAAQLKRIADALESMDDALESMDDGDSLVRSARIWGSEQ